VRGAAVSEFPGTTDEDISGCGLWEQPALIPAARNNEQTWRIGIRLRFMMDPILTWDGSIQQLFRTDEMWEGCFHDASSASGYSRIPVWITWQKDLSDLVFDPTHPPGHLKG
jgi:hypothetical protein